MLRIMKVYIKWTYKHKKNPSCTFQSDLLNGKDALLISEDLERTGRVKAIEFYDEQELMWTKKELNKLLTEIKEEPQDVHIFFDGGFMKEERISGLGIVIYYKQNDKRYRRRVNTILEELSSSNEAEYAAFYESIRILEEMGVHHQTCTFSGDSQVVLNQLSGEWTCFDDLFNRYLDRIEEKMKSLGIMPIYNPISRKENKEADSLASQALQGIKINSEVCLDGKEEI